MIRYYGGYEGSGKTCMMTQDLYRHYLSGGEVWAFPGYELFGYVKTDTGRNKKVTLSQTMSPEDILVLLQTGQSTREIRQRKIAIGLDEVDSFFNHHTWYNKINDILSTVQKQRRKLGVAILMTGPMIETLPPDIREMVHEYVSCQDRHITNKLIPRGTLCVYQRYDRHHMFSHPRRPFSRRMIFNMKPWYKYYDTYAAVDALSQFTKIKFKGREVIVGPDGTPIRRDPVLDTKAIDGVLSKYAPEPNPDIEDVQVVVRSLLDRGLDSVPTSVFREILPGRRFHGINGIGTILKDMGAKYQTWNKTYKLTGVSV